MLQAATKKTTHNTGKRELLITQFEKIYHTLRIDFHIPSIIMVLPHSHQRLTTFYACRSNLFLAELYYTLNRD